MYKKDEFLIPQYKIWNYKYDLAEINKYNFREVFRDYFKVTTSKITILSMILALNVLFSIFSIYLMGQVPIFGFLVIELTFFTILLVLLITNLFWSILFLEVTVWMRMLFFPQSGPIGLASMNTIDGFYLIVFAALMFIIKIIIVRTHKTKAWKWIKIAQIMNLLFVTFLTAGFAILMNHTWILDAYLLPQNKIESYYLLLFGFNILKYLVNCILYLFLFKTTFVLIKRYRF